MEVGLAQLYANIFLPIILFFCAPLVLPVILLSYTPLFFYIKKYTVTLPHAHLHQHKWFSMDSAPVPYVQLMLWFYCGRYYCSNIALTPPNVSKVSNLRTIMQTYTPYAVFHTGGGEPWDPPPPPPKLLTFPPPPPPNSFLYTNFCNRIIYQLQSDSPIFLL